NDSEENGGTMSQILARLYRKASLAEKQVVKANQDEIMSWYCFAESFKKKVKEIMDNDMRLNGQQAKTRVYKEVVNGIGFAKIKWIKTY
ncbi:11917_t:CDS:2, partial [Diversispora eburnea]